MSCIAGSGPAAALGDAGVAAGAGEVPDPLRFAVKFRIAIVSL
jgi:hypothetical protein